MKSILSKVSRAAPFALVAVVGAAALISADPAMAQSGDLMDAAERLGKTADAFKKMVLAVIYMIGIGLLGLGCWLVYKDSKQPNQGHAKTGIIAIGAGILMLGAPFFAGMTGNTFMGTGHNATKAATDSHY